MFEEAINGVGAVEKQYGGKSSANTQVKHGEHKHKPVIITRMRVKVMKKVTMLAAETSRYLDELDAMKQEVHYAYTDIELIHV